jgi:hypothetical protein
MNYAWKTSNYKVVTLLKTFPMISNNLYKNEHEMVLIAKKFETYVSLKNLSFSLGNVHSPWKKCPAAWGTWALPQGKLSLFPQKKNLIPGKFSYSLCKFFFKVFHLFLREPFYSLKTSFCSMWNLHCSLRQLVWNWHLVFFP